MTNKALWNLSKPYGNNMTCNNKTRNILLCLETLDLSLSICQSQNSTISFQRSKIESQEIITCRFKLSANTSLKTVVFFLNMLCLDWGLE